MDVDELARCVGAAARRELRGANCAVCIAPTEVKCEFLKSSFFVVALFLWSNRVVIRINMHREATRTPTWPLGGGVKDEKNIFLFP